MKKSIKILALSIASLMILLCVSVGSTVIDGYNKYKEVISSISLEEKVNEIKSDKYYTSIEKIDKDFLDGIVSVEDHRFYKHGGLDFISILRATINNVVEGKIVQGGSTITQQLAKNIYLDSDKNLSRKISEVFLANDLEKSYSKDEILEMYVNIINYGDNYIGIKEASEGYFGTEPNNLDLNEASILAGLPQSPNGYALSSHYNKAIARQKVVLEAMNKNDVLEHSNEYYVLGDVDYRI